MEPEITKEMLHADTILRTLTTVGMQALVLAKLEDLVADGKIISKIPGTLPYYMVVQFGAESQEGDGHEPAGSKSKVDMSHAKA